MVNFVIGTTAVTATAAGNRVRRDEPGKTTQLSQSCQGGCEGENNRPKQHIDASTLDADFKQSASVQHLHASSPGNNSFAASTRIVRQPSLKPAGTPGTDCSEC